MNAASDKATRGYVCSNPHHLCPVPLPLLFDTETNRVVFSAPKMHKNVQISTLNFENFLRH